MLAGRTTVRFTASGALAADYALDALQLTVLGVLLTVGLSTGLALGFGIGEWQGAAIGVIGGLGLPVALITAFRWSPTRTRLAKLADRAIDRPRHLD
jgi:hypothetical protein